MRFSFFLFLSIVLSLYGCIPERPKQDTNIKDRAFLIELKNMFPQAFNGDFLDTYSHFVKTVTKLQLSVNEKVKSIQGIEYFTNLKVLEILGYTSLSYLDVTTLSFLQTLKVNNTSIRYILLDNPNLKSLDCSTNDYLTSLDVSSCPSLEKLICSYCQIQNLNIESIQGVKHLDITDNFIKYLNLSGLPALNTLICNDNPLKKLDIRRSTIIEDFSMDISAGINELEVLYIDRHAGNIDDFKKIKTTRGEDLIIIAFQQGEEYCSDYDPRDESCSNGVLIHKL